MFSRASQLLGPSIDELLWATSGGTTLSTPCVLRLAAEMLARLQALHAAGYVHNDVSLRNFCMGRGGEALVAGGTRAKASPPDDSCASTVYLVDFGLATRVGGYAENTTTGTPLFASAAAHRGQRRRCEPADDLEALCFILAYLGSGALPWEHANASADVFAAKQAVRADQLTEGLPQSLADAIGALWRLARVGRPPATRSESTAAVAEYACDAPWPTACRDALLGLAAPAPYDWETAGISWSSTGEIQRQRAG